MGGNLCYQASQLAIGRLQKLSHRKLLIYYSLCKLEMGIFVLHNTWSWTSDFLISHDRLSHKKISLKCISRPTGQCSSFPFFSFSSSDIGFQVPPKCLTDPCVALTCHPSPVVLSRFRSAIKLLTPSIRLTKNMRRLSFCQTSTPISSAYLRVVSYSVSDWKSLSRNPGVVVMRSRSSCQRWIWSITVAGRTLVVIVGGASGFSELEVDVLAFLRRICGCACVVR